MRVRRKEKLITLQGGAMPIKIANGDVVNFIFQLFDFGPERLYSLISFGPIEDSSGSSLIRVQSECWWGRAGSVQCDCDWQFQKSKEAIAKNGSGLIIFCHDQVGKGIGLKNHYKVHDRAVKEHGKGLLYRTDIWYEGFKKAGMPVENRKWDDVVTILRGLGVNKIMLLTNNPDKISALESCGFVVQRLPLFPNSDEYNEVELRIKKRHGGHLLGYI